MSGLLCSCSGIGGDGVRVLSLPEVSMGVKPTCVIFGVAVCTRIGGAWSWKALGGTCWVASMYWMSPSSADGPLT